MFVYLASTFIVFWERDITSENHGTPVHLHIIVHTTIYFLLLLLLVPIYLLCLILCKRQGRRNWKLLCTRWEQSYLLFASPGQLNVRAISGAIARDFKYESRQPPISGDVATYLSILGVLRETNLSIFAEGTCRCTASHLPLGVTNEERDANLSCITYLGSSVRI